MSEWKARRFWTRVEVTQTSDGFGVALDDRPVRSPAKLPLVLPTHALAEAIAAEWQAQEGTIDPLSMPLTRAANSALDKVAPQYEGVIDMLAEYGGTDLLCYRAAEPDELTQLQMQAWDPLLAWLATEHGITLNKTAGVVPVEQSPKALTALRALVAGQSVFELTGFHDLVTLSGSLVIALAVRDGHIPPSAGWEASRCDELYQISKWGADDEAEARAAERAASFLVADQFLRLARA